MAVTIHEATTTLGIKRNRCPRCNGKIIVSEFYQYSHDFKVLSNGKLSKKYTKLDCGSMESSIASCDSDCGVYWNDGEFLIDDSGNFIDTKYIDRKDRK